MKIKRKLLLGSISFVIPLMSPIFLTSCAEENNDPKNISLIDLTYYMSVEHNGFKTYGFGGYLANDELKNKTKSELDKILGIKDESSRISKTSFEKIIKNVKFANTDKDGKPTVELDYSQINTSAITNKNLSVSTIVWDIQSDNKKTIVISIGLLNGATWSNGSTDSIVFSVSEQ